MKTNCWTMLPAMLRNRIASIFSVSLFEFSNYCVDSKLWFEKINVERDEAQHFFEQAELNLNKKLALPKRRSSSIRCIFAVDHNFPFGSYACPFVICVSFFLIQGAPCAFVLRPDKTEFKTFNGQKYMQ